MGELLTETERAKGGQPHQKKPTGNVVLPVEPTLAELGLTKRDSAKAQMLAALSEEEFQAVALGLDLEAIERPKAKERHRQGSSRGGKGGGKLPQPSEKTRDAVGAAVGLSGKSYERAKAVAASR